jgi:DNA-binding NarL/FixJ family response regulator
VRARAGSDAPAGATVLLVEDERDTRELLGRALTRAGHRALLAADAREGLDHLEEHGVDVVVTDIVLGADARGGLGLLTELRARGVRVPVIVITAYADLEKVKIALNEGAAHLLEKPFRAPELLAAIERVRVEKDPLRAAEALFERVRLTEKEREVARHVLLGLSSTEIAERQGNSERTIRQHVSQIYAKCSVGSRAELFRLVFSARG